MNSNSINKTTQEYIEALLADLVDMKDTKRINILSQQLVASKSGWIDEDICNIQHVDIPSLSDGFLYWNLPSYYNYLQTIPRYYWFVITIPDGVSANDPFIDNTKDIIFAQLQNFIKTLTIGRVLFYEINHSYITFIIKVAQPCSSNIKRIRDKLQLLVDNIYYKFFQKKNTQWKVVRDLIGAYYDIPVTLRQLEKRL